MREISQRALFEDVTPIASSLVGDRITGVSYLLPKDDAIETLNAAAIHVVSHEIRVDFSEAGRLFFDWYEESHIAVHPIRIAIGHESLFKLSGDLKTFNMSNNAQWKRVVGHTILKVRILEDEESTDDVETSIRYPIGVRLETDESFVELAVVQPHPPPGAGGRVSWDVSTVVSAIFPPYRLEQTNVAP